MPKDSDFKYTVELENGPSTFMVYKWHFSRLDKPDVAYQVNLYEYDDENHRCSCEHGSHVKFEGKMLNRCKHIKLVLDAVNKIWDRLIDQGRVSDNSETLKQLSSEERQLIFDQLQK